MSLPLESQRLVQRTANSGFMAEGRPPEELYDLEIDPHEVNNLADDPRYRDDLEAMRRRLDDWICTTGDQGDQIEDPAMVQSYRQQRLALYRRWLAARGLPEDADSDALIAWWTEHYE